MGRCRCAKAYQGRKGDTGDPGPTGPAGPGVPTGGNQGEFLSKNSATDYDAAWLPLAECLHAFVEAPELKEYTLILHSDFGLQIMSSQTRCASGSGDIELRINGAPVGAGTQSVTTSKNSQAQVSQNIMNIGDRLTVAFTSLSDCLDCELSIQMLRI